MASAVPVPGQPGRLFIPGRSYETKSIEVDEGHMTISEVSTQDLEDYERDSMNGLGATTATAVAPAPTKTVTTTAKPVATTALAPTQKPAAPAPAAPAPTPVVAEPSEGGFAALLRSPWYWVGIAAVAGVGIWWLMKRRAPVQQVSAVETLGLEGVKAPKRRKSRRKSRKSKA